VLTDKQLSDLFADGTAPERDPAFARQVAEEIGRTRRRMRVLALSVRAAAMFMLLGAVFVASRLLAPVLTQLVEGTPEFMGVPLPTVVLGVVLAMLTLRARLHAPLRRFVSPPA
jgi:hypothetical protein